MAQQNNIAIVVLIGLPGSGKTTFAQKIMNIIRTGVYSENFEMVHICYDQIYSSMERHIEYKEFRQRNIEYIKQIITVLKGGKNKSEELHGLLKTAGLSTFCSSPDVKELQYYCVVIDDNMYYRSMRYEIFNVAKQFSIGFVQVYLDCSVSTALRNNSKRLQESQLPNNVILKMNEKIERPNSTQFFWEKQTQFLSSENGFGDEDFKTFFVTLEHTFRNPITNEVKNNDCVLKSQIECVQSTVHQCDIAIRRLISKYMLRICGDVSSYSVKSLSTAMIKRKGKLLNDVKNGIVIIPTDILINIGQDDFQVKLQSYLEQYFRYELGPHT